MEQPLRRRCRDRDVHRVRHEGPSQGPRQLRGVVAALDLRRLLPQLPHAAGEVRPDDPARPRRARLGPHSEQGLRPRGRAVLRDRLVRQLLAHRRDGRHRLRVVRAQVPGLVRQVRQVVGALLGLLGEERPPADRVRAGRRLRVPAPLLVVHGAVPDSRGHRRRRGRRPGPHVLLGNLPLD